MSSKRGLNDNAAKISFMYCEPPFLQFGAHTSQFHFESFDEPLHLPPPTPAFRERLNKIGHSGVPANLLVSVTNTRFQTIRDVSINVTIKRDTRVIYPNPKEPQEKVPPADVAPQKCFSVPIHFTCLVDGNLTISTVASFTFDNQKKNIIQTDSLRLNPSVSITRSKPGKAIQVKVENKMNDYLLLNVKLRTPDKQIKDIARFLRFEEIASSFIIPEKPLDKVEISWSLPSAPKCSQIIGLEKLPETKPPALEVNLSDVPQTISALKPFNVTVEVKNLTQQSISGEVLFQKGEGVLHLVGKYLNKFEGVEPLKDTKISFNFIALSQGFYSIPDVELKIDGIKEPVVFKSGAGILVIGNDE